MQRLLFTLCLGICLASALFAQGFTRPTLTIAKDTSQTGETVCVPVSLYELDGLSTIQGGIAWDTAALSFVGAELGPIPNFTSGDLNLETAAQGSLLYAWSSETGEGVTIANGSLLLELCFLIKPGTPPGAYYISFMDEIKPEVSIELVEVKTDYYSGWVSVPAAGGGVLTLDYLLSTDCGYARTDLAPSISGGTPPYSFFWVGPYGLSSSSDTLVGLVANGEYRLSVMDQSGTTWLATALYTDVNLNLDPTPIEGALAVPPSCTENTGSITLQMATAVTDYTYVWSTGATTVGIENLATGLYSVTVTRTSDGCTQERFFELQPDDTGVVLLASATIVQPDCATQTGGAITLVPAFPELEFVWSTGATTTELTDLATGTYTVSVTNGAGCTEVREFVLDPLGNFDLEVLAIDAACGIAAGELSAVVSNGPDGETYTYAWSTGATTDAIALLPAGTYGVTVTSGSGCVRAAEATIFQQEDLLLDSTVEPITCNSPGRITLSVAAGVSIDWPDSDSTGLVFPVSEPGMYVVTLAHPSGCEQDYAIDVPAYTAPFQPTTQSIGAADCFSASGSIALGFTTEPFEYTYLWSDGPAGTGNEIVRTDLAPGNYELALGNPFGCTDTLFFTVPLAEGAFNIVAEVAPIVCESPGSITVTNSNAGALTYAWSTGATTPAIEVATAGEYSVTVTTLLGCERTLTATVTEAEEAIEWSTEVVDNPSCGQEDGAIEISLGSGTTATWNTGAAGPGIEGLTAGTYELYLSSPNGCRDTASFTLEAGTELAVEPDSIYLADANCNDANGSIRLVFADAEALDFVWSNGANGTEITDLSSGTYGLTVSNAEGCTAEFSYTLETEAGFDIGFLVEEIGCDGTGTVVAGTTLPNVSYLWETGATTAELSVSEAGFYTVSVTNQATGCVQVDSIAITAVPVPQIDSIAFACDQTTVCQDFVFVELYFLDEPDEAGDLTVTWSDGAFAQTVSSFATRPLQSGVSYGVTVTNELGCSVVEESITADCPDLPPLRVVNYLECEVDSSGTEPVLDTYLVAEVLDGRSLNTFTWTDGLTDTSFYRSRRLFDPTGADLNVDVADELGSTGTNYVSVSDLYQCAEAESSLFFTAPHVIVEPGASFRYPIHVYNYAGKTGVQTISWNSCLFTVDSIYQYDYAEATPGRFDLTELAAFGYNEFEVGYADFGNNPAQDSLLVMEIFFTALSGAEGVSPFLFSLNEPAPIRVEHGSITVSTSENLVAPGDANRDNAINQLDVLYLGLTYGATGPDRRRQLQRDTEYAPSWSLQTPASGLDLRNADPDGNGRVAMTDTLVLALNWTNGDLGPGDVDTTGGVPLYVAADTLAPDTDFRIPVFLGDQTRPATNVYGLATTLTWEGSGLVGNALRLDFTDSWLTEALTYAHSAEAAQRIDFALVGRDGQDRSGNGPIAWISGRTTAEAGASVTFRLGDTRLMNAAEGFFAVAPRPTEVTVDNPVATLDPALAAQLVLYPVPATERLFLRTPSGLQLEELTVLAIDGRKLLAQRGNEPLNIAQLPAGVYLLRVRTDRGVATLRWVK